MGSQTRRCLTVVCKIEPVDFTITAVFKHTHFINTVTGDGLHLPCITAVGEENGVKMGIVQSRITRTNTIYLIAVGKGGLRRSSVVGKLFEHKLILRACKSLMAGHPLETKIERLCDSNPGILFRKVENRRFLYIQIRPSRMPS